jgi:hypothetical protein
MTQGHRCAKHSQGGDKKNPEEEGGLRRSVSPPLSFRVCWLKYNTVLHLGFAAPIAPLASGAFLASGP